EDRRFAAARRGDETDERCGGEPGNKVGDDLLPSIEILRVADVEEREPLERADHDTTVIVRRSDPERARAELERRVLLQDRAFEQLEGFARFQPELDTQELPCLAVDLERVRLAACAIEGKHQLSAQPLPKRVFGDKRFQLADELLVAAEREVGVDAIGERGEANFLESCDLSLCKGVEGEIGERGSAPERERLEQRPRR